MEAKKIEIIKDWSEPKLVHNIPVFLGFANFYWRFIQRFSRIAALLTSMLKTIGLPDKPAPSRNNGSRLASCGNDDSKSVSQRNNGNSEVDRFGVSENNMEHAKKSIKLSKLGKSKSKKMSKFRNLAKLRKKLSKSGNFTNFDTTKNKSKFFTPDARTAFNRLWLAFIEAPILQYFDPECHI